MQTQKQVDQSRARMRRREKAALAARLYADGSYAAAVRRTLGAFRGPTATGGEWAGQIQPSGTLIGARVNQ